MKDFQQEIRSVSLEELVAHTNNTNLENEVIAIDGSFPFHHHNRDHFPVRMEALIIVHCIKGKGRIGIDLEEHIIEKNSLLIIQPQNYINMVEEIEPGTSNIIVVSKNIAQELMPKLTDLLPVIMQHKISHRILQLPEEEADEFINIYNLLKVTLKRTQSVFRKKKVVCLLQTMMLAMMELATSISEPTDKIQHSRKEEIMAKFILEVSKNFRAERQVSYYADNLCITPKHLSAVVKEISGRTASEWIESYVTMEAKVLLNSTNLTIQEIASKLNFTNQSFFGKYFKHQTGQSPSEYRQTKH